MILKELGDCAPRVWQEELRVLEQWLPLPQSQWKKYAARFRQAANALEGRPLKGTVALETADEYYHYVADTRHIVRWSYAGWPNTFAMPLPPEPARAAEVIRAEAALCDQQAEDLLHDRNAGVVRMRQQCVTRILAHTKRPGLEKHVVVLLTAIGWSDCTAAGLKMARSRRGETRRAHGARPSGKKRTAGLPRTSKHLFKQPSRVQNTLPPGFSFDSPGPPGDQEN